MSERDISDIYFIGLRPDGLSLDAIREGQWIPDDWAVQGSSRSRFVYGILMRFCRPMMEKVSLINCGDRITTDFTIGCEPNQISIVDQLIATILGYNWSIIGFLACIDNPREDRLDSISRYEYTKARDFLESWTRTEGYRCLSMGPQSSQFRVNLYESAGWRDGVLMGRESSNANDFYQINRAFTKRPVAEVMKDFEDQIWSSASPIDFVKKVAQVRIVTI